MPEGTNPVASSRANTESSAMRLGYGCSGPWAMRWFSQRKALGLVRQAADLGITFFDTGNFYGGGEAERRLGYALKTLAIPRERLILSTKTGTQLVGRRHIKDFSGETIKRDITTSLKRLGVDYLDIVYLHGPTDKDIAPALESLEQFRATGVIRKIGLCSDSPNLREWACHTQIDAIMAPFNILNQNFLPVFREAKQAGKHTAAIAPLAQGLYRRGFFIPKSFSDLWYIARARVKNATILSQARALKWVHHYAGWEASELALAFVLAHPCFDVAVTTTSRISHLKQNCLAAQRVLPGEAMAQLKH